MPIVFIDVRSNVNFKTWKTYRSATRREAAQCCSPNQVACRRTSAWKGPRQRVRDRPCSAPRATLSCRTPQWIEPSRTRRRTRKYRFWLLRLSGARNSRSTHADGMKETRTSRRRFGADALHDIRVACSQGRCATEPVSRMSIASKALYTTEDEPGCTVELWSCVGAASRPMQLYPVPMCPSNRSNQVQRP